MNLFRMFNKHRSSVTIGGVEYVGRNITINGNRVVVDGVQQGETLVGPITVMVKGDVDEVHTGSGSITVTGNAGSVTTASGNVQGGNVHGQVKTASGNISCGAVAGSVKTVTGNISHR